VTPDRRPGRSPAKGLRSDHSGEAAFADKSLPSIGLEEARAPLPGETLDPDRRIIGVR